MDVEWNDSNLLKIGPDLDLGYQNMGYDQLWFFSYPIFWYKTLYTHKIETLN